MTTNTKLRAALLGSGAMLALAAGPAFAAETDDLKAQIDSLQARLDQIEKQKVEDASVAAAPADAVVGGDFPGSFKLPGSDTSYAFHGYTKLDAIYSLNARLGDSFVESSIPGNHNALQNTGPQLRLHARQSRLSFETRTPTNYGQLHTFIQTDFFGTSPGSAGGNNTSNARIRHAYGELGNFLAGQTWTNFTDLDDQAETLDFFGPIGVIIARQAQVRYTMPVGKWRFAAALENPATQVSAVEEDSAGNSLKFAPGAPVSVGSGAPRTGANNVTNPAPDFTVSANYTDTWGHAAAAGVIRDFNVDDGGDSNNSIGPTSSHTANSIGGGGLIGATLNWGQWVGGAFGQDQFGFNGYWGEGIDRYLEATSRQGGAVVFIRPNATGTDFSLSLQTQQQYGGFGWVQHHWSDQFRSTVVFGVDKQHWKGSVPVTTAATQINQVESLHTNLIWSPVKSVNIGVEYMFGAVEYRNLPSGAGIPGGSKGEASQLQFSAQYVF